MSAIPSVMESFSLPENRSLLVERLRQTKEHRVAMESRSYESLFEKFDKLQMHELVFKGKYIEPEEMAAIIVQKNAALIDYERKYDFASAQIDAIYNAHAILTLEEKREIEEFATGQLGSVEDHEGQDLVLMVDYDGCGSVLCSSSYNSYISEDEGVSKIMAKLQYFIDVALNLGYENVIFQNASTRQHHPNDSFNQVSNATEDGYSTGSAIANYPEYVAALNLVHGEGKIKFSQLSVYDLMCDKNPGYFYRTGDDPMKFCDADKSDMIQKLTGHYAKTLENPVHCVFIDDYPETMQTEQDRKLKGGLPDNARVTTLKYDFFGVAIDGESFPPVTGVRDYKGAAFAARRRTVSDASSASSFVGRGQQPVARAGAGAGAGAGSCASAGDVPRTTISVATTSIQSASPLTAAIPVVTPVNRRTFWDRVVSIFKCLRRYICCARPQTPVREQVQADLNEPLVNPGNQ